MYKEAKTAKVAKYDSEAGVGLKPTGESVGPSCNKKFPRGEGREGEKGMVTLKGKLWAGEWSPRGVGRVILEVKLRTGEWYPRGVVKMDW